jgi:hypothetical protein
MPDLVKMMTDKTTYPDDLTIEVHGEKMTMKEWRDGLGLKQEFHKHTDEIAVNSWRYDSQLKRLKEQDTDLDTQALAKYTSDLYSRGPDVETAYRLFTEEKRLKKQVEEAEKRGYDKAKAEPPAPPMPGGRRGSAGKAPLDLPKDLNARMQLALQDPEIQALMTSE